MGSGSLSRRDTEYEDGSTWMGNGTYDAGSSASLLLRSSSLQIMEKPSASAEARKLPILTVTQRLPSVERSTSVKPISSFSLISCF